jgi:hypothetical protein
MDGEFLAVFCKNLEIPPRKKSIFMKSLDIAKSPIPKIVFSEHFDTYLCGLSFK